MSVMSLSSLKPHRLLRGFSSTMVGRSLLNTIPASTLPTMESRAIPGNRSSQTFHLCSGIGL